MPPPAFMQWTAGTGRGLHGVYAERRFQQKSLLQSSSRWCIPPARTFSSVQVIYAPSISLHSMARGDVCIGALHAFGARCAHPPLASGVFSALIRRQDAVPSSQYIGNRSLNGSARQEVLPRLRRNCGENKRNREYYQSMASHLKWSIT